MLAHSARGSKNLIKLAQIQHTNLSNKIRIEARQQENAPMRQNADLRDICINRRRERVLGVMLAVAIGVGLAAVLVVQLSA